MMYMEQVRVDQSERGRRQSAVYVRVLGWCLYLDAGWSECCGYVFAPKKVTRDIKNLVVLTCIKCISFIFRLMVVF